MTEAQTLATGWLPFFYSADRSIRWKHIEREHSLWLDPSTLLLGRIDAEGETDDGDPFFADWKTISGKAKSRMASVKAEYRFDPQMLTYGVLTNAHELGERFLVRWAMKSTPALYFWEWYTYSAAEIAWWREMLLDIAQKIRFDRLHLKPFVTNLTRCLKYGVNYPCEFLHSCCSKQQWDAKEEGMLPRVSHLQTERDILERRLDGDGSDLVILDATRVETWLECNERYRRQYVEGVVAPPGPALATGIEFHELLHAYYKGLVK